MSELAPAPYRPERRDDVAALLRRVWERPPSADELRWWLEENPVEPQVATVMQDDGRPVGLAALSFLRARVGGDVRPVPFAVHLATDPAYRGRGVFGRLQRHNEARAAELGAPLALVFPNAASRPILQDALGWSELGGARVWARLARPASGREELPVEEATELDAREVDELARSAAPAANHVVKDTAFLDWRYRRSPREYRLLRAHDGRRLRGLLALRPRRVAVVADLLAAPEDAPAVRSLLRRAARDAQDARALIALPAPAHRRAYARCGFLPTPRSVRVLARDLAGTGRLFEPWQFAFGDFDVF